MKFDILQAKQLDSTKVLILVGGSGDTKENLANLAKKLHTNLPLFSVVTFSFTQIPETQSLKQQVADLNQLAEELINVRGMQNLSLMATSMGAYSVCFLLKTSKPAEKVEKVILLDPADYETEEVGGNVHDSWSGFEKYEPKGKTASDWLKEIKTRVKVDVVHLILKNHGPNGYIQPKFKERGKNEGGGFTRLNTAMAKSFYKKLPAINRGKYLEVDNIPHAFIRDGNIEENERWVANLVAKLMEEY